MFITAVGMVCPIGLSAATACAAKRAGISALAHLPYYDNSGEPIVGGTVPDLDWSRRGASRVLELLVRPLAELLREQTGLRWDQVALLLCLPDPARPGSGGSELAASVLRRVEEASGVQFDRSHSRVFASGHTAAFEALREARAMLGRSEVSACVVCGADSYVNAATLLWLDQHYRLKTPANRDGVIPGEAGAAVMVEPQMAPGVGAEVIGLGFGKEQAHLLSEEPLLGRGLADAARSALTEARLGMHEIDLRLSDVTGELYGFKELPLLEGRLMRDVRKKAQPLWHWAEAIGDTGSAAGVAQLVLANEAFRKGYAPGERVLCLTSSVLGNRAAAVLRHCRN
jgi:3-oxoacyl-[acyl-carrier-protein] synthase I